MEIIRSRIIYNASQTPSTVVNSVTGDGVDNTDPSNPVISFNTRFMDFISTNGITPALDDYDMAVITGQNQSLVIQNPTGTPVNGNAFVIRIKDDGTARAITFGNKYRAIGSALPTITTINKNLYFAFVYNSAEDFYDVFPSQLEV